MPPALSRRFDEGRPARERYVHHRRRAWVQRIGGTYTRRAWGWLNRAGCRKTGVGVRRSSRKGRWMSRFVDVNYRIVPFMRQTRSFFSPWPLIPTPVLLLLLHLHFLFASPIDLSICPRRLRLERTRSMEGTKNKTKSTYQMCGNKGRRNHGWIPRLDTFKGAEMPILAVATAASNLNSDAFHYVPLCSMYSSRHATFVARWNKDA